METGLESRRPLPGTVGVTVSVSAWRPVSGFKQPLEGRRGLLWVTPEADPGPRHGKADWNSVKELSSSSVVGLVAPLAEEGAANASGPWSLQMGPALAGRGLQVPSKSEFLGFLPERGDLSHGADLLSRPLVVAPLPASQIPLACAFGHQPSTCQAL